MVNPNSPFLNDDSKISRLGMTDFRYKIIFLSNNLSEDAMGRVLLHELGHAVMFSYGIISDIKRMTKRRYRYEMEEWICNFITNYSPIIFEKYNTIMTKIF